MEFIKSLSELNKHDVLVAGGKGASLGEMIQAGISVPPGFVIISKTFDNFIQETGLREKIDEILKNLNPVVISDTEKVSQKIRKLIEDQEIPENTAKDIMKEFKKMETSFVAVRSSATVEDGKNYAWAGQLESFLNTDKNSLLENIKKCWSSLFTPQAISYRFENKLDHKNISVAVIVQKMIESEISGVAFSVHPINEDGNQILIEAVIGLGEGLVSGQITPESYTVEKDSKKILGIHNTKISQILSGKQILELTNLIINIENHYGFPCDIEWTYENRKFYILQSRPITTLGSKKWIDLGKRETTLLEASIKISAWSDILSKLTGKGYKNYSIDSEGNYKTTEEDEKNVLNTFRKNFSKEVFEEKTVIFEEKIIQGLHDKTHLSNILDLLILQFGHFLYDRMKADVLFQNPNTSSAVKQEIISWRNNPLIFESHSDLIVALSKKLNIEKKYVELCTVKELKKMLSDKNIELKKIIQQRKDGWKILLLDGKIRIENNNERRLLYTHTDNEIKGQTAYGSEKIIGIIGKDILVVTMTEPKDIHTMSRYKAVITDQGGILSHAAITCRELHITCIIGTGNATQILNDGDEVEVDADNGIVSIIKRKNE